MEPASENKNKSFSEEVADKEKRKLKALQGKNNVWFGLGMMGLVGWSVVVPAVVGASIGLWLDKHHPQTISWTLTLLLSGIITGGIIAWNWVDKEDKEMHKNKNAKDE